VPQKSEVTAHKLREAGVTVVRAPIGLSRQKENSTSKNKNGNIIWTVEWIHPDKKRSVVNCSERTLLWEAYRDCLGLPRIKDRKRKANEQSLHQLEERVSTAAKRQDVTAASHLDGTSKLHGVRSESHTGAEDELLPHVGRKGPGAVEVAPLDGNTDQDRPRPTGDPTGHPIEAPTVGVNGGLPPHFHETADQDRKGPTTGDPTGAPIVEATTELSAPAPNAPARDATVDVNGGLPPYFHGPADQDRKIPTAAPNGDPPQTPTLGATTELSPPAPNAPARDATVDVDGDLPSHFLFFLHRPRTSSSRPVLIPLDGTSLLRDCLRGKTVLEFPTIYVFPDPIPSSMSDDFILEEEYVKQEEEERKELEEAMRKVGPEELRAMQEAEARENDAGELDGERILDVLKRDLGGGV